MLSIVHAAETQFRHESARRDRDRLLRSRISERHEALRLARTARYATARPVPADLVIAGRSTARLGPTTQRSAGRIAAIPRPIRVTSKSAHPATWARPIGAASMDVPCAA